MERIGVVNAASQLGAIEYNGKILLAVRVEGTDRKSFFAIAESQNGRTSASGIIQFSLTKPLTRILVINDMRLVKHGNGLIYGLFSPQRKYPMFPVQIHLQLLLNAESVTEQRIC